MAALGSEQTAHADDDGMAHRVTRRRSNRETADRPSTKTDAQGLLELACECIRDDCERFVKVPPDVYRRILDADQYLLQAGHHAFARYRTIISVGQMRIEERA
jgi:hypothetical protein